MKVVDGPGGEIRYLVFNFNTMPFGATTPEADPAKALAVRQAIADLIDRDAISEDVYKGTFTPLYSYVPEGLTGANEALKDALRRRQRRHRTPTRPTQRLEAAGVTTPLDISTPVRRPSTTARRRATSTRSSRSKLEESGLFTVNLQSTEWVQYSKDRVADLYPAYQLGWFPDYSDADNYLTPFFLTENFLANHYDNPEVNDLILEQAVTTDPAAREALIERDPGQGRGRPVHDPATCRARRSRSSAATSRAPRTRSTRRSSSATARSRRADDATRVVEARRRGRPATAGRPRSPVPTEESMSTLTPFQRRRTSRRRAARSRSRRAEASAGTC